MSTGFTKAQLRDSDIRLVQRADTLITQLDGCMENWSQIRTAMGGNLTAELSAFASLKTSLRAAIAASPATQASLLGTKNSDD